MCLSRKKQSYVERKRWHKDKTGAGDKGYKRGQRTTRRGICSIRFGFSKKMVGFLQVANSKGLTQLDQREGPWSDALLGNNLGFHSATKQPMGP